MNESIRKNVFSWVIQVGVGCAILIAGLEIGARYFLPEQIARFRTIYFGDQRYGFLSKGALADRSGYINFRSDFEFRNVAFYPDRNGKMTLEYDCTFHSDKLGFVSNSRPYEETSILLLGDSFAQGDGGCAWIPRLDPRIRKQIYSTAVMGLGVLHWSHIVADLEKLKIPRKILIVFITDDFFRTDWVYDRRQIDCINEQGDCAGLYWYPISDDMSGIAAARFRERNRPKGFRRALEYNLIATYSIYRILTSKRPDQNHILKRSLAVASDWTNKYDIRFLWVNEPSDNARSSAQAKALANGMHGMKIAYCDIPSDGFMPRDPHPNAFGYDVLKACVEDVVRAW